MSRITKEDRHKIIYLAGPYSHDHGAIEHIREAQLTFVSALLEELGVTNFSPITHSARQAQSITKSGAYAAWAKTDRLFIEKACDEVWVLDLEGWKESVGVTDEIAWAKELNKPVFLIRYSPVKNNITKKEL